METLKEVAIPEVVADAFRTRVFLTTPELARLLGMSRETVLEYVRCGQLPWRQKGFGRKSPRRVFSFEDIKVLLRNMQRQPQQQGNRQWPSEEQQESGAAILPFMARMSSEDVTPTTGSTSFGSTESTMETHATPRIRRRPRNSPAILRRKRSSKRGCAPNPTIYQRGLGCSRRVLELWRP